MDGNEGDQRIFRAARERRWTPANRCLNFGRRGKTEPPLNQFAPGTHLGSSFPQPTTQFPGPAWGWPGKFGLSLCLEGRGAGENDNYKLEQLARLYVILAADGRAWERLSRRLINTRGTLPWITLSLRSFFSVCCEEKAVNSGAGVWLEYKFIMLFLIHRGKSSELVRFSVSRIEICRRIEYLFIPLFFLHRQ